MIQWNGSVKAFYPNISIDKKSIQIQKKKRKTEKLSAIIELGVSNKKKLTCHHSNVCVRTLNT